MLSIFMLSKISKATVILVCVYITTVALKKCLVDTVQNVKNLHLSRFRVIMTQLFSIYSATIYFEVS